MNCLTDGKCEDISDTFINVVFGMSVTCNSVITLLKATGQADCSTPALSALQLVGSNVPAGAGMPAEIQAVMAQNSWTIQDMCCSECSPAPAPTPAPTPAPDHDHDHEGHDHDHETENTSVGAAKRQFGFGALLLIAGVAHEL